MIFLKIFFATIFSVICGAVLSLSGSYLYLSPNLPSAEALRSVELQIPLRVYSAEATLIEEFGEMRRTPIAFAAVPDDFINALLSAEDDNFANHYGVDFASLLRAAAQILQTGSFQTGGSTITMQVAKNYFLTSERTLFRKASEILLALQIERELGKDEILELYVNKIYLGNRAYGIEAAANIYYGKSINELTVAQMAMIAGLPKAPSSFNPLANPARSLERRNWILGRMLRLGHIGPEQYEQAIAEPEIARQHIATPDLYAPYIAEMARQEAYAMHADAAYTQGYSVYTTVDDRMQTYAREAVLRGLLDYDQRHGYRGPEARLLPEQWSSALASARTYGTLVPAVVTAVENDHLLVLLRDGSTRKVEWSSMRWARPFISERSTGRAPSQPDHVAQVGDLIRVRQNEQGLYLFSQLPKLQSALVSLDPHSGAIKALSGGFSFEQSNFNRATQAKRQTGSSFKPFVYSAALDAGYTAASMVNDSPLEVFEPGMKEVWRPKNDNNTFLGPITLREALYRSRNIVSIRILQDIGIQYTVDHIARTGGIDKRNLPNNLSLSLGAASLTPLEMTAAWATFANGGYRIEPYLVERVHDRHQNLIYQAKPDITPWRAKSLPPAAAQDYSLADPVLDARTAYLITDILKDVIKRGTGRRALELQREDLAGKTGTTNDSIDSWFIGYNHELITGVWNGFDQPSSLGNEYGSTIALPIWIDYTGKALADQPISNQPEPKRLNVLRIDPVSGRVAPPGTPGSYFEIFKDEDIPPSMDEMELVTPDYQPPASEALETDQLFDLF